MKTKHVLLNTECLHFLRNTEQRWDTIFADPPDNLGQKYGSWADDLPTKQYNNLLKDILRLSSPKCNCLWISFNARHISIMGKLAHDFVRSGKWELKSCVQTFTFGQHNQNDLGNDHRPLWRFRRRSTKLYPDAIRIPSWRQIRGDKRADPRGRVPSDVFDFPRVTGNSKQRRSWHPTQLNEGLVDRCLRLTTPRGGAVLDPFGGTGTTLRVCKRAGFNSTTIEMDEKYCTHIARENGMTLGMAATYNKEDGGVCNKWEVYQHTHCDVCGRELIQTSKDFLVCPEGHGKLCAMP